MFYVSGELPMAIRISSHIVVEDRKLPREGGRPEIGLRFDRKWTSMKEVLTNGLNVGTPAIGKGPLKVWAETTPYEPL